MTAIELYYSLLPNDVAPFCAENEEEHDIPAFICNEAEEEHMWENIMQDFAHSDSNLFDS